MWKVVFYIIYNLSIIIYYFFGGSIMEVICSRLINSHPLSILDGISQYPMQLEYYLLESNNPDYQLHTYGVKVILAVSNNQKEFIALPDITPSKEKCLSLIDLLQRNDVTPINTYDVIYDCIA